MFRRKASNNDPTLLNSGYRYAWSLCANQQDAEDLLHDAWIRLVKRYRKSPDKPLLFRTIKNLYIDQYRRSRRVEFVAYEGEHQHANDQVDSIEDRFIDAEAMQIQLDKLNYTEREILYLSVVEGYTADEISQSTDTARGTILSMLHRSKIKLRQAIVNDSTLDNIVNLTDRVKKT